MKTYFHIKSNIELMILIMLLALPENAPMTRLSAFLTKNRIPFEFCLQGCGEDSYVAIASPSLEDCKIDAIFHPGSLGYKDRLIEIWDFNQDDVEGYLTPEEAFERFKEVINN